MCVCVCVCVWGGARAYVRLCFKRLVICMWSTCKLVCGCVCPRACVLCVVHCALCVVCCMCIALYCTVLYSAVLCNII